jgi:hypothetical protein
MVRISSLPSCDTLRVLEDCADDVVYFRYILGVLYMFVMRGGDCNSPSFLPTLQHWDSDGTRSNYYKHR